MKNSLRFIFISFLSILVTSSAFTQYNETIRTGRPGEAIGPFTVGARVFQVQAGTGYLDYMKNKDLQNGDLATVYGNYIPIAGVFRMGLTEHFEVSLGMAYTFEEKNVNGSIKNKGLNAFAFGFRSNIYVGEGWVPTVGVQVNIGALVNGIV